MNLTELARARILIEDLLLAGNGSATSKATATAADAASNSSWKSIAARIAIIACVYGLFFAVKRTLASEKRDARVSARIVRPRRHNRRESGDEICPICLEPPRSGVRPGCGHRLCAACLRSYCEALHLGGDYRRARAPPCPLCRAPLVTVTLACDQINLSPSPDGGSDCTADPVTAQWIREYNKRGGGIQRRSGFLLGNAMMFIKLLLVSIALGILARSQNKPFGIDLVAYSSFLVTALGMTLLVCLWLKCQEQAALEADD